MTESGPPKIKFLQTIAKRGRSEHSSLVNGDFSSSDKPSPTTSPIVARYGEPPDLGPYSFTSGGEMRSALLAIGIAMFVGACGGGDDAPAESPPPTQTLFNTSDGGWYCVDEKCQKLGSPGDHFAITPDGLSKVDDATVVTSHGAYLNKRLVSRSAGAPAVLSEDKTTVRVARLQGQNVEQCTIDIAQKRIACEVTATLPDGLQSATLIRRDDNSVGVVGILDGKLTTCEASACASSASKKKIAAATTVDKFAVAINAKGADRLVMIDMADAQQPKVTTAEVATFSESGDGMRVESRDGSCPIMQRDDWLTVLKDDTAKRSLRDDMAKRQCAGGSNPSLPDQGAYTSLWHQGPYWGAHYVSGMPYSQPSMQQCYASCSTYTVLYDAMCYTGSAVAFLGALIMDPSDPGMAAGIGALVLALCQGAHQAGLQYCTWTCVY